MSFNLSKIRRFVKKQNRLLLQEVMTEEKVSLIRRLKRQGRCIDCGKKENLTFHHLKDKHHDISWMAYKSKIEKRYMEREIGKCVLLCEDCHKKRHLRDNNVATAISVQ